LDGERTRCSVILLVVVGGLHGAASVLVWRQLTRACAWSVVAGIVLLGWIVVQVAMLGVVSWLQPAVAVTGVFNLVLAHRLTRALSSEFGAPP